MNQAKMRLLAKLIGLGGAVQFLSMFVMLGYLFRVSNGAAGSVDVFFALAVILFLAGSTLSTAARLRERVYERKIEQQARRLDTDE